MEDIKNSTYEQSEWDASIEDVSNVMRGEFPDHVNRLRNCMRLMAKASVKRSDIDTIKRYAKRYDVNEAKLLLMYY